MRNLPQNSPVHVTHFGGALDESMKRRAESEATDNRRYTWRGEIPREDTLRAIGRSHLLVTTSLLEGGGNVVTEAIACETPVVSSYIEGSRGILGEDYPGYFPVGDTQALGRLIGQLAIQDHRYDDLVQRCEALRPLVDPQRERESWRQLLARLF